MRGAVSVQGIGKAFGDAVALRDVSLEVAAGELLTLLGPSGCGKTTLLRILAGFEMPDRGRVLISGKDMAGLPAYRRPVNTVFQHYALFPHRTVAGNVAFGLEQGGCPREEIPARIARALELVRLPGFGGRRIEQLSGGQKQRVALARALVLEPDVLLLDEPMAALDPKLRKEMQVEVKNLQERLGTTFVFVTHDQDEALVMSDRVAVMNGGRIEQVGTPDELYDRPRTRFVADFLGVRNLLSGVVRGYEGGQVLIETTNGLRLRAYEVRKSPQGGKVAIGIRAERVSLVEGDVAGSLEGTIEDELYLGDRTDWRVRVAGETLTVAEGAAQVRPRRRGDPVRILVPPSDVLFLDES